VVAIVGRTNVGKSTLFNRFCRRRYAIMDDEPGVTRDRLYADVAIGDRVVTVVDTGGLGDAPDEWLADGVADQVVLAMNEADIILFMVDGRTGVMPVDREVAARVRRAAKPTILVVNKVESPKHDPYEFAQFGFEEVIPISAKENVNIPLVTEALLEMLPLVEDAEAEADATSHDYAAAIIGRPNVGKSSLLNALIGDERALVSEVPGTTRDALDTLVGVGGRRIRLTDTAGMRKKGHVKEDVEYYSVVRALRAVDRSDIALLVIDGSVGVTEQDQKIAGYAHEAGKLVIVVANKWDLVIEPPPMRELPYKLEDPLTPAQRRRHEAILEKDLQRQVRDRLAYIAYAPILCVSALTGRGIDRVFPQLGESYGQYSARMPTSQLNRLVLDAAIEHPAPSKRGKHLRVYYATQAETCPPTVVLFVNDPELMHFGYERYLRNRMRQAFGLDGTPIRFLVRERAREQRTERGR